MSGSTLVGVIIPYSWSAISPEEVVTYNLTIPNVSLEMVTQHVAHYQLAFFGGGGGMLTSKFCKVKMTF